MTSKKELTQQSLIRSIKEILIRENLSFIDEFDDGDCYFDVSFTNSNNRVTIDVRYDMTEFFIGIGNNNNMKNVRNEVIINIDDNYIDNVIAFVKKLFQKE